MEEFGMKRFLSVVLAFILMFSLAGCGSSNKVNSKDADKGQSENKNTQKTEANDEKKTEVNKDTKSEEPITLTYLAWDVGAEDADNAERVMLKIFDEEHPNINTQVLTVPEGDNYDSYISTLAASNQMPDVFMWGSVPDSILRDWAGDVSEYASKDEDYNKVNATASKGGQVKEKVFGIPKAMHLLGMFINKDIYKANNIKPLEYGYTMDQLLEAIEKNTTTKTKGVDNFVAEMWYPMTQNKDFGFATYDGEKMNFDSLEYAAGIEICQKVTANNWDMKNTTPLDFFGSEGWAWGEIGGIANQYDGTWSFGSLKANQPFEADFVGLPGGRAVLVNDFIFVSKSTKNKEQAYELAKWMGFSQKGILTRLEFADSYAFAGVPLVTNNEEIDEKFLASFEEYPEFIKAYHAFAKNPELLAVEGYKEVPGFAKALYEADTGVQGKDKNGEALSYTMQQLSEQIIKGAQKLSDNATKMTEIANGELAAAREAVEAKVK